MKKYVVLILIALLTFQWGCKDEEFLNREPTNILLNDQVWKDRGLVLSVLGDLYNRYPDRVTDPGSGIPSVVGQSIKSWQEYTNFNEAFASNFGDYWRHRNQDYDYVYPGMIVRVGGGNVEVTYWDYAYIRDLNLFIQKAEAATQLPTADKEDFVAEARFLRAAVYFEEAKRVGGVPLILEPMTYDYSGDPSSLQFPRAKEHEIYDFVISEMEAIKNILPADPATKSRATTGAALAMEARAALYAASIAKYGQTTPQVSLPGGEVGIPAGMAAGYYGTALRAAQELINGGQYALYLKKPDLAENFASIFYDKANNPEVIFAEDFKTKSGKVHNWTIVNQPRYQAEEQEGGRVNPSLNLVQSFEKLDNTFAPLPISDANGNFSINAPKNATLVFSYVGFPEITINVDGRSAINVQMDSQAKSLDNVVVTALGIRKEARRLGYATATVNADQIALNRTPNIASGLEGKMAGVNISTMGTGPAGSTKIRIRGQSSFSSQNSPLIVINGVPMDNTSFGLGAGNGFRAGQVNSTDGGDGLSSLNADDIESMTVLKGATASALYGSRAKDGVIMITTKNRGTGKGIGYNFPFLKRR